MDRGPVETGASLFFFFSYIYTRIRHLSVPSSLVRFLSFGLLRLDVGLDSDKRRMGSSSDRYSSKIIYRATQEYRDVSRERIRNPNQAKTRSIEMVFRGDDVARADFSSVLRKRGRGAVRLGHIQKVSASRHSSDR